MAWEEVSVSSSSTLIETSCSSKRKSIVEEVEGSLVVSLSAFLLEDFEPGDPLVKKDKSAKIGSTEKMM